MGDNVIEEETKEKKSDPIAELEALRSEKAALETQLAERTKAAEEKARAEELARAKAEGELNALKSVATAQQNGQTVTEEQWKALEEQTGVSRSVFITNAQIADRQIALMEQKISKRLQEAEDKAKSAQERLEKMTSERSLERTTEKFYEEKPHLMRHKKDLNEFVSKFPESDRSDPTKLKEIMAMGETYIRGKVGVSTMQHKGGGSPKFGAGNEELESPASGNEENVDLTGLQTEGQIRTIMGIKNRLDNDTREKEEKLTLRFASADKHGVAYSAEDEWNEAQRGRS